jgi:hypothetical protein
MSINCGAVLEKYNSPEYFNKNQKCGFGTPVALISAISNKEETIFRDTITCDNRNQLALAAVQSATPGSPGKSGPDPIG